LPTKIANLVTRITVRQSVLPQILIRNRIALGVEAKMQKVSAMLGYVVGEGRLCALKPSEWSILLAGVVLCGFVTLVFLISRL
jgi:hypothetical protein